MLKKAMNRLVGFQRETVEEIDWKKIGQQLKWMNGFSKGYRGRIGVLTGFSIFFALLGVAYAAIYKDVVDVIMGQIQGLITQALELVQQMQYSPFWEKISFLYGKLPSWFIWVLLGYLLYKIVSYCYSLFMQFFTLRLSMDLGLGIKRRVYATILESDWIALTQYRAGDLVQRVSSDADTVSGFAMNTVPSMIVQVVQFIAAFAMLVSMDWTLTIIAFIGVPLYLFVVKLKGRRTRDYNKRSLELGSKNSSFLYESMANIMVIKSFMLVPQFIRRYRALHQEMFDLTIEKTKYGIVTGAIIGMLGRILSLGVFCFLMVRLIDGHLTIGTLFAFGMLRGMVSGPVNSIMGFIMGAIEISASAERVMTLYELPRDRTQIPEAVQVFEEKARQDGMGLKIDNLEFAYVKGETVLRDVDVDVKPGEVVAFVGPSGEGKTTLIRLALGLLTPDKGRAYLVTGRQESLDLSVETRAFFSYVPQGNTLFSGTIRENMEMGNPEADEAQIIQALEQACIWSFVKSLPEGLDTMIGERGVGVSEGQAQRLAIARALLRGAPILLLDEATSALDIYTEKEVLDNIFGGGLCKTCVLTTHRPSVFTVCDKIYRVRQRSVELIKATRDQEVNF
ncbi:MAG: ABC transporter ATP-binding protein/permease [Oscillospiraceae bacterium]|jgi:ABC-type bacteriocin/lantibiotic exporter with double-glycine peptidase domain|nr:ABC transporter ATP-binding protein/permease [Oscillospiraceae bacterium]